MINTTTATQRRDRRREFEEKYGLRSTTKNNVPREENFTDVISGQNEDFSKKKVLKLICLIFIETRQLKSESSTEEPLINMNNNQQPSSSNTSTFTGKFYSVRKRVKDDRFLSQCETLEGSKEIVLFRTKDEILFVFYHEKIQILNSKVNLSVVFTIIYTYMNSISQYLFF